MHARVTKMSIIRPSVASSALVHGHRSHTPFACFAYLNIRTTTIIISVDGRFMRRSPARDVKVRYLKLCYAPRHLMNIAIRLITKWIGMIGSRTHNAGTVIQN